MSATAVISSKDRILGGLWGSLVGDALGVPVEFKVRAAVQLDPVKDMREYGTHKQPRGTWSDDSSMLLCTADSLVNHKFSPVENHSDPWCDFRRVISEGNEREKPD
jgi:ADP-ribosyl-[dinitrogen reductase] hydrolase